MTDTAESKILSNLLHRRHSCRAFIPDSVPRATIERMVELAGRSPSWCNTQPWQLVITSGEATAKLRFRLAEEATANPGQPDFPFPDRYSGAHRERRVRSGVQLYEQLGIGRDDRAAAAAQAARNFEFFDAPHAAIVTTEAELGPYGAVDCGIFVQSFLLAAECLGVAAVPQAAIARQAPFLRDYFGLPESRLIVCAISFGWPDRDHPVNGFRTERSSISELVRWEGDAPERTSTKN